MLLRFLSEVLTLNQDPSDTVGAMLAAIAATWTIFVATCMAYFSRGTPPDGPYCSGTIQL